MASYIVTMVLLAVAIIVLGFLIYKYTELSEIQEKRTKFLTSRATGPNQSSPTPTGQTPGAMSQGLAGTLLRRRRKPKKAPYQPLLLVVATVALVGYACATPVLVERSQANTTEPCRGPDLLLLLACFLLGSFMALFCVCMLNTTDFNKSRMNTSHATLFSMALIACTANAQIDILGISSFTPCIDSGDFTCSDESTVVNLRVQNTEGSSSSSFLFDLTVVPADPTDIQFGSGIECQSDLDTPCLITTPAKVTFSMGPSALRYHLKDDPSFFVPYTYLANIVGSVDLTDPGNSACADCECELASSYHTTQVASTATIVNETLFTDPNANFDHYRCPYTTIDSTDPFPEDLPTPQPIAHGSGTESTMNYRFKCKCPNDSTCGAIVDDDDGDPSSTRFLPTVSMEFWQQRPLCRVYAIENPPEVVATIIVDITVRDPRVFNSTITESVNVTSIQEGLQGATAFSPNGFFQLKILNPLTPTGRFGPDIPGYIVVCSESTLDPGRIDMLPVGVENNDAHQNPWPTLDDDPIKLPIPFNVKQMAREDRLTVQGTDDFAMFYYINPRDGVGIGRCCGCLGVDPNLYAHPPTILEGNRLRTVPPVTFPYKNLIGASQGGLGGLQNFLTCIPNFGLGYRSIDPTTPCEAISDFITYQEQLRALEAEGKINEARSIRVPHLPLQWNNLAPNFWVSDSSKYLYYEPGQINSIAIEAELVVSGDFLGYFVEDPKPNGFFSKDAQTTFCYVGPDSGKVDGLASYKACNSASSPRSGSFSVQVSCGLQTSTTPPFTPQTRLVTNPSTQPVPLLEPGQCADTGTLGGPAPFFISLSATLDSDLLQLDGTSSNIVCEYKLLLSDDTAGFVASNVIVDQISVACSFAPNGTTPTPPTTVITGLNNGTDVPTFDVFGPTPEDPGTTLQEVLKYVFIALACILGLGAIIGLIAVCIQSSVYSDKEKDVMERSGVSSSGLFDRFGEGLTIGFG
jgi:hypothetical protein